MNGIPRRFPRHILEHPLFAAGARSAIEKSRLYRERGFGFLPLGKLVHTAKYGDDLVVLVAPRSELALHYHPAAYCAESWLVLQGEGVAFIGHVSRRRYSDRQVIRRWDGAGLGDLRDGVVDVNRIIRLAPGTSVDIAAGEAHGCTNTGALPLLFYGALVSPTGGRGYDPTFRKLRVLPEAFSVGTLKAVAAHSERSPWTRLLAV